GRFTVEGHDHALPPVVARRLEARQVGDVLRSCRQERYDAGFFYALPYAVETRLVLREREGQLLVVPHDGLQPEHRRGCEGEVRCASRLPTTVVGAVDTLGADPYTPSTTCIQPAYELHSSSRACHGQSAATQ